MRRSKLVTQKQISILAVDDDPIITDTIQDYFKRSGYHVETENNPQAAVERVRQGKFDIMLLDFLMSPICGDQVVEEIREFNRDLFIVLLTGHKSMAPPVKTIRQLDIQGYYEKDDRFDQLELLVESCVKSIKQMRTIREFEADLSAVVDDLPEIYQLQDAGSIANGILSMAMKVMPFSQGFVRLEKSTEVKWFFYGDNALQNAAKDAFAQVQGNSWQTTVQGKFLSRHHCCNPVAVPWPFRPKRKSLPQTKPAAPYRSVRSCKNSCQDVFISRSSKASSTTRSAPCCRSSCFLSCRELISPGALPLSRLSG